jgi:hypothetical protein
MQPTEIIRTYTGSDADLAENARTIHSLLVLDLPLFTAFDNTINASFGTQFLASITAADTVVADSAVIDQLVQKTEVVITNMDRARNKYNDVKYFVLKTFPNSPGAQGEFGLNDYQKARRNAPLMIQFLDEIHKACVKNQTQLVAKGLSAAAIAEIQTIRTDLMTANTSQEVFKKQRPKLTEERIKILNTCFDFTMQVINAGQLVFRSDFAKKNQYIFNQGTETSTKDYTGTVAANTTKNIATITFALENVFTFRNTGIAPLVFCLSTTDALEGIQIAIGGGAVITKSTSELNPNATKLLVKNNDAASEGSYEVELDN